ncbi:MAG: mechanosensitive ion channel [Saprospiraceae bacterium]|nr:mechanosensitive ion channel [Saprospiraceae bacterium]MCB9321586.1 mechanosensitive ion channel [Lewinellaceae bacterium]
MNWLSTIQGYILDYAPKVVLAILVLIIGFWIINRITLLAEKQLAKQDVDDSLQGFLKSLISIGLKIMLIFSVLGMVGVETTSFIAVLGAAGLAIGLALQGSLANFAAGVLILFFKPYRTGDLVTLDGHTGVVQAIQIFNTVLLTPDNRKVIIPNAVATSGSMINISGPGKIRVDMTFGIGYSDDLDLARSVIEQVNAKCPYLLSDHKTDILVHDLGNSSVNFAVRPWCSSSDYWNTYFYFQENIKKAFDREGVSIPFPQMDVHLNQNA